MAPQGRYWEITIPHHKFTPYLPPGVQYIAGQLEVGGTTGYLHWQLLCYFPNKVRAGKLQELFGQCHTELTRSQAIEDYVWKEDTSVAGTRFELGQKSFKRNSKTDWEEVWEKAKTGKLNELNAHVKVTHYRTLKAIEKDHLRPVGFEREIIVFWGAPGTGKSRRAWEEAGLDAYPKDPCTKFWDGYQGHEHVVIDEFRGDINISHVLRWFDRYPVNLDIKFGATTFNAKKIWVTSNLDPRLWYPDANQDTVAALIRRLNITHFSEPLI